MPPFTAKTQSTQQKKNKHTDTHANITNSQKKKGSTQTETKRKNTHNGIYLESYTHGEYIHTAYKYSYRGDDTIRYGVPTPVAKRIAGIERGIPAGGHQSSTQISSFFLFTGTYLRVLFLNVFFLVARPPQILPLDLGFPPEEAPLENDDAGVFSTGGMAEALGHGGGDRPEVGSNPSRLYTYMRRERAKREFFFGWHFTTFLLLGSDCWSRSDASRSLRPARVIYRLREQETEGTHANLRASYR